MKAGLRVWLTGPAVAEATLGQMVLRDLAWLTPIMIVVLAVLLAACLRTVAGLLLTMLEVLVVGIGTIGLMGWVGVPVTLVTTELPVILVAIAVLDEIHLFERHGFYVDGAAPSRDRVRDGMLRAIEDVGAPIVVTSLTTALAFLSFAASSILPLRHFGVFSAFGILLAMVLTFTLVPALTALTPPSWFRRRGPERVAGSARYEAWLAGHPRAALFAVLATVVVCLPGLRFLQVQDSWVENFPPDSDLVVAEQIFNESFWGSYRFEIVLNGPEGLFRTPEGAKILEEVVQVAEEGPRVGGTVSILVPFAQVAALIGVPPPLSAIPAARMKTVSTLSEWFVEHCGAALKAGR